MLAVTAYWLRGWRRNWHGSVVSSFVAPLLYLVAMGYGLGSIVDARSGGVDGVGYVAFVAPGVLAATAMQTAVSETTWPIMDQLRWRRHFEAVVATPVRPVDIATGTLVYVAAKLLATSVVFVAVGAALGSVPALLPGLLAIPAAVLTGLAFAAPVLAFSAALRNEAGFNALLRFGVTPMFLFSGTFFPVTSLPAVLQPLAQVTPLWHGVQLCRAFTLGRFDLGLAAHAGYLLGWVVIGTVVAAVLLRRRLIV